MEVRRYHYWAGGGGGGSVGSNIRETGQWGLDKSVRQGLVDFSSGKDTHCSFSDLICVNLKLGRAAKIKVNIF